MQISAISNIAVPLGFPNQHTIPVDFEYISNIHCNKQLKEITHLWPSQRNTDKSNEESVFRSQT
jgi:hypothetical protein